MILTVSPNLMLLGGRTLILVRIQQVFFHLAWYFQHVIHSNPFAEFDPPSYWASLWFFSILWLVCLGRRALSRVVSLPRPPPASFRTIRVLAERGDPGCCSLVCYLKGGMDGVAALTLDSPSGFLYSYICPAAAKLPPIFPGKDLQQKSAAMMGWWVDNCHVLVMRSYGPWSHIHELQQGNYGW